VGVDTGTRLRVQGEGEKGQGGGPAGNLYVVLHVANHEIFSRNGDDIECDVPISFVTAVLGGTIEVPTIYGKAKVRIQPGTQSGTVFRLRGKGVKNVRGYGQGDHKVKVIVEIPKKLNVEQKEALTRIEQVLSNPGSTRN